MKFSEEDIDRIIQMAWEDRTPFESIEAQFGVNESAVVKLMQKHMKRSSFIMWRKRMTGRKTKHGTLHHNEGNRFKCNRQRNISLNKISKR